MSDADERTASWVVDEVLGFLSGHYGLLAPMAVICDDETRFHVLRAGLVAVTVAALVDSRADLSALSGSVGVLREDDTP